MDRAMKEMVSTFTRSSFITDKISTRLQRCRNSKNTIETQKVYIRNNNRSQRQNVSTRQSNEKE